MQAVAGELSHQLLPEADGADVAGAVVQPTQSNFGNEIGKKSLVSRIPNGQRTLTLDDMRSVLACR